MRDTGASSSCGTWKRVLRIGLSTHSPTQAKRALAAGADYLAVGPIYATGTKPTAEPVTPEYVRWAAVNVTIPWSAIGGITLKNPNDVLATGARRICVVSAILNAPDVAKTCTEFRLPVGKLMRRPNSGVVSPHWLGNNCQLRWRIPGSANGQGDVDLINGHC